MLIMPTHEEVRPRTSPVAIPRRPSTECLSDAGRFGPDQPSPPDQWSFRLLVRLGKLSDTSQLRKHGNNWVSRYGST